MQIHTDIFGKQLHFNYMNNKMYKQLLTYIECKDNIGLCNYIDELHENYYFNEEYDVNNYAEKYYGDIDIYCIDEIIDDILNAPVTMEEKLADVGMSIKDFL